MHASTPQIHATARTFAQRLSSTRRGARLARLLAVERLTAWDISPRVIERAEHVVAQLAANAALHGRVQGRDFLLALTLDDAAGTLRISVSDMRGEHLPAIPPGTEPGPRVGSRTAPGRRPGRPLGHGTPPALGKTVWAELACPSSGQPCPTRRP